MAIGSAFDSALAGMNLGQTQMLSGATGVASGNLDNLASDMETMELGKIEFEASAKVAEAQSKTLGALIDMIA